jgi:hypothetical protein
MAVLMRRCECGEYQDGNGKRLVDALEKLSAAFDRRDRARAGNSCGHISCSVLGNACVHRFNQQPKESS